MPFMKSCGKYVEVESVIRDSLPKATRNPFSGLNIGTLEQRKYEEECRAFSFSYGRGSRK